MPTLQLDVWKDFVSGAMQKFLQPRYLRLVGVVAAVFVFVPTRLLRGGVHGLVAQPVVVLVQDFRKPYLLVCLREQLVTATVVVAVVAVLPALAD